VDFVEHADLVAAVALDAEEHDGKARREAWRASSAVGRGSLPYERQTGLGGSSGSTAALGRQRSTRTHVAGGWVREIRAAPRKVLPPDRTVCHRYA
jgi:hypothetical protein